MKSTISFQIPSNDLGAQELFPEWPQTGDKGFRVRVLAQKRPVKHPIVEPGGLTAQIRKELKHSGFVGSLHE